MADPKPKSIPTTNIPLANIYPNPWRNFGVSPIDDNHVANLVHSINRNDFFGGVIARRKPGTKNDYEIACGHHRIEACRKAGLKTIDIPVAEMDDDDMICAMADENGSKGAIQSACAVLNDVFAVTKRLAAELLLDNNDLGTIVPRCRAAFSSQKSFEVARGMLNNGNGCGEDIITRYLGEGVPRKSPWPQRAIKAAVATLKASNRLTEIMEELGIEAETPTQKERVTNARKKTVERNPNIFDDRCPSEFSTQKEQTAFFNAVTESSSRKFISREEQLPLAKHIVKEMKGSESYAGPQFITSLVKDYVKQKIRDDPTLTPEEKHKLDYNETHKQMDGDIKQVVNGLRMVTGGCDKIMKKINAHPRLANHALLGEFARKIPQTIKILTEVLNRTDTACFVIERAVANIEDAAVANIQPPSKKQPPSKSSKQNKD